jgi:endo-1,4-beta-D-glucanase Y
MVRAMIVGLTTAVGLTAPACSSHSPSPQSGSTPAEAFLAKYVTSDGRVLRHGQGDDIVSEGQAYGMLIAENANRPDTARAIWAWTMAHLHRPDGLLISHADSSGKALDTQSAADADTLTAYALLRYRGPDQDALRDAGRKLSTAVLDGETTTASGAPVLLAGPWAKQQQVVNPSYWMPAIFTALGQLSGDDRWRQAVTAGVRLLAQLTDNGRLLPTDWARLSNEQLVAIPNPGGSAPVQYGLDAARLPMWFATGCTTAERQLAARWWSGSLSRDNRAAAIALSPSGATINEETNPLPLLAGAAAARAAGDTTAARTLRALAAQQSSETPTYYGDAWLALGGALLDRTLDPCREASGG